MTISLATTFFLHTHQTPGPEGSNRGNDDDGPDVAGGDSNNDNSGTNSVPHRSPSNLGEQVPAELTEHLQGEGAHDEEERVVLLQYLSSIVAPLQPLSRQCPACSSNNCRAADQSAWSSEPNAAVFTLS